MTGTLGYLGLVGAAAGAAWALARCLVPTRGSNAQRLASARAGLVVSAASMLVAAAALMTALLRGERSLSYVASHTDAATEPMLRFASLWAGEEGSLLFWALCVAAVGALVAFCRRRVVHPGERATLGVLGAATLFFTVVVLAFADPFAGASPGAASGRGLHPQLRHWAMVVHPPLVMLGSGVALALLAIVCGALAARRADRLWVDHLRRWALAAWLMIGAGIVVGAAWAYLELGWGGYWAWDPVENAALLPWLALTALLHTMTVHRQHGRLKVWTASLAGGAFILTLVGAAVTRSSGIASVHAFGGTRTVPVFWAAALAAGLALGVLVLARRRELRPDGVLGAPSSREGVTAGAAALLCVMGAAILMGTLVPIATRALTGAPVSMATSFYARTVVPAGIAVLALMSLSAWIVYGRPAPRPALALTALVAGGGAVAALAGLRMGFAAPTVILCGALLVLTVMGAMLDLWRSVRSFAHQTGYGAWVGLVRVLDVNHRRYGGQLAHAGIAVLAVGVAGSSLLSASTLSTVHPGETIRVGGREVRFDGLREFRVSDASIVEGLVTDAAAGVVLRPQRRFYDTFGETGSKVALKTGWREDLYVTLVGWEPNGASATLEVRTNPLALWVWVGAALAGAGGLLALCPRLLPRARPADLPVSVAAETAGPVLSARAVRKEINGRPVLEGADLEVHPGECVAVLGANGAGKTTLLRVLAGLTPVTGGVVEWRAGRRAPDRRRIGFIGHQSMLYRDLTVFENLVFASRLYGLPDPAARARELVHAIGLADRGADPVSRLSRGQVQRAAIARALIPRPDLLLADEPFTGLDARWAAWLRGEFARLAAEGAAILFTHHDAAEAASLAGRVVAIASGRLTPLSERAPRQARGVTP